MSTNSTLPVDGAACLPDGEPVERRDAEQRARRVGGDEQRERRRRGEDVLGAHVHLRAVQPRAAVARGTTSSAIAAMPAASAYCVSESEGVEAPVAASGRLRDRHGEDDELALRRGGRHEVAAADRTPVDHARAVERARARADGEVPSAVLRVEGKPVTAVRERGALDVEGARGVDRGDEDRHRLEPRAVLAAGPQAHARHLAGDVVRRHHVATGARLHAPSSSRRRRRTAATSGRRRDGRLRGSRAIRTRQLARRPGGDRSGGGAAGERRGEEQMTKSVHGR